MKNPDPVVTVLMSVYNGEKYLREAVESILNQTLRDFEFIIIDDGSTESSKRILEECARRDPRIRLISHENSGLTKSLNTGLAEARGEFIARMDADDVSCPERLREQIEFLRHHPDHVAIGCGVMITDSESRPVHERWQPRNHAAICKELLRGNGGAMTHPAVMIRTSAIRRVGGYDDRFTTGQDLDLFIRLSEIGLLENIEPLLLLWRRHTQSINHTKYVTWQAMKRLAILKAIERQGAVAFVDALFPDLECEELPLNSISWARSALDGGQLRTATHYAVRAFLKGPGHLDGAEVIWQIGHQLFFKAIRISFRRTCRAVSSRTKML